MDDSSNVCLNNNVEVRQVPVVKQPLKSPENKIIIQKVENVKFEIINTSTTGQARRISSFFTSNQTENLPEPVPVQSVDEIESQLVQDPVDELPKTNSLKLLSAKIPENDRNQSIPLKMVRTMRQPKPKPILKPRYHKVVTVKTDPPQEESSVKSEVLKHEVVDTKFDLNLQNPGIAVNSKVENFGGSQEEEVNCLGFSGNDEENIGLWGKIIKAPEVVDCQKVDEPQPQPLVNSFEILDEIDNLSDVIMSENIQPSASHNQLEEAIKNPVLIHLPQKGPKVIAKPLHTPINLLVKPFAPGQIRTLVPMQQIPTPKIIQIKSPPPLVKIIRPPINQQVQIIHVKKVPQLQSPEKVQAEPTKQYLEVIDDVKVIKSPEKPDKTSPKKIAPENLQQKFDEVQKSSPSQLIKPQLELSTKKKPKKSKDESIWLQDIFSTIGTSRIAEIDADLKTIPQIATGSKIETENIEFKLIIRYLLRVLGVDSIMDTAEFAELNGGMGLDDGDDDQGL